MTTKTFEQRNFFKSNNRVANAKQTDRTEGIRNKNKRSKERKRRRKNSVNWNSKTRKMLLFDCDFSNMKNSNRHWAAAKKNIKRKIRKRNERRKIFFLLFYYFQFNSCVLCCCCCWCIVQVWKKCGMINV